MILTPEGPRMMTGKSRDLIRGTLGTMLDWLVAECRGQCGQWVYGIDWFDQWEPGQRIWLLEVVAKSFLTTLPPPPRWAVFEATVDAIMAELAALVQIEINDGGTTGEVISWRQTISDAVAQQSDVDRPLDVDGVDPEQWRRQIRRWIDRWMGPMSYVDAERHRDGSPGRCAEFLLHRCLPEDFLTAMPPLRTIDQSQLSIDRIQDLVFESGQ